MKAATITLLFGLIFGTSAAIHYETALDEKPDRRPLDLPSGGAGTGEDEEDAPETIVFYGANFEADAFVFVLDRSGSMQWEGRMELLQLEVRSAIDQFSDNVQFNLIAFSSGEIMYADNLVEASVIHKASAKMWVGTLEPMGFTCMLPAIMEALAQTQRSELDPSQKTIIVVSDGRPGCVPGGGPDETLAVTNLFNWEPVSINTVGLSLDEIGRQFMLDLASQNGGTYTEH